MRISWRFRSLMSHLCSDTRFYLFPKPMSEKPKKNVVDVNILHMLYDYFALVYEIVGNCESSGLRCLNMKVLPGFDKQLGNHSRIGL